MSGDALRLELAEEGGAAAQPQLTAEERREFLQDHTDSDDDAAAAEEGTPRTPERRGARSSIAERSLSAASSHPLPEAVRHVTDSPSQEPRTPERRSAAIDSPPTQAPGSPGADSSPPGSPEHPFGCAGATNECAICLGELTKPKPFPNEDCPHVYCGSCLLKLQAHTPDRAILCPQCRRRGPVPPPLPIPTPLPLPPLPVTMTRRLAVVFVGLAVAVAMLWLLMTVPLTDGSVDCGTGNCGGGRR